MMLCTRCFSFQYIFFDLPTVSILKSQQCFNTEYFARDTRIQRCIKMPLWQI